MGDRAGAQYADVVVVGAGVVGCSVAASLAARGRDVCVVDRGAGPASGSTSASSAVVRFNYSTWEGVATAWEARAAWMRWEDHLGVADPAGMARMVVTGSLVLDAPDHAPQRVFELFDAAGVPYERWDAETIRTRLPLLEPARHYPPKALADPGFWADPDGELSGYWVPDEGFVDDPQLATHNLMTAAEARGAAFRFRTRVAAIERTAERVRGVRLDDGTLLPAPVVVNAAGPHSGQLNRMADVLGDFAVTTRPLRQEVHEVRAPARFAAGDGGAVVADFDLGTYFRPTPSGGLLIGSMEPACDPLVWLEDPDTYDPNPTKLAFETQVLRAARRIPSLAVPGAPRGIAGVYDVSDDWIPIYDKTSLDGFFVAIGTSGNQFKNAPVIGDLVAAIVEAAAEGIDHDREPVQLRLPRTGNVVDLSHYSRLRPPNKASSGSVTG
ncbi:NAD(P)/FAD-dependent oxidoreductase [Amycolatopsis rubida]|uniref:Sarcosine oxidase subunit beta n=1 Tax=Amycolatopsis rubida TaxID=112413 RepID=A0A1I5TG25_9PSEU|nr:FAD-dependent oxidoreductase [Amycolatopsis rubida]SFP82022.1 sarcosine oxidase subunit beta [Amycolatopsis rubida]